ncbi:hypothetical protein BCU70_01820 [Vibrio sp. 10N.286.49.C2]|uniref:hypothetical protein n=1 Tax=unclassified Vibrio TaxID=2614977 RepID=UPI000C8149D7|nr:MULTISPECIES: hypothetical protein [unclassified Vibrio]PMH42917.1 hypothetical protein BCU70_01820 [Vibrio sp. 10N.286.49.C2]PMH53744.1 hypothetical protein BCU66_13015 [Vibrio sp. 10N.286.49.B1]PMH84077.1 hypothetical protein BCU58_01345 [Vibrio sp. 10N.286.48.B7]
MKQQVLVFGGLGAPGSSVVSLYQALLTQLSDLFDLIAIDPIAEQLTPDQLTNRYPFSYSAIYDHFDKYCAKHQQPDIAACLVLTPVRMRLSIIEMVSERIDVDQTLFIVEKPSFSLEECERGFDFVIPALQRRGARFYFIDTVIVALSIEAYIDSVDGALPLPKKIVAIAADNPINLYEPLHAFEWSNQRNNINRRKLLSLKNNGGGGAGLDMGIHAVAALFRLLSGARWDVESTLVTDATLEALTEENISNSEAKLMPLERELGAETHLYAQGIIKTKAPKSASIPYVVEGGKGGDIWDRRLELYYDDHVVVLGLGTLRHPPYFWRKQGEQVTSQVFSIKGSGYQRHFSDILSLLSVTNVPLLITPEQSEEIMRRSMVLIATMYPVYEVAAEIRELGLQKVTQHLPRYLTSQELTVRNDLDQYLKSIVF